MQTVTSIAPGVARALPETDWVWLSDGTPVYIRPVQPADLDLERRFVHGLSRETAYQRLLSGRNLLPAPSNSRTGFTPTSVVLHALH